MDIGQMGGGDKLFAKIDQGIRAAKVVICCVSEKYAESPNCNREVSQEHMYCQVGAIQCHFRGFQNITMCGTN